MFAGGGGHKYSYSTGATLCSWPGGVMVRALDLIATRRSQVRLSVVPLSGNNLGQVVHRHLPLSSSSLIWYRSSGGDALRLER